MNSIFLSILNMSLIGAFVIIAICLVRQPLKLAPKIISYCLWAVAGFRLIFPVSIESTLSLIPFRARIIEPDTIFPAATPIQSNIYMTDVFTSGAPQAAPAATMPIAPTSPIAPIAPAAQEIYSSISAATPTQLLLNIGAYIWLLGFAVMIIYGVVSYIILTRKMRGAVCIGENIYKAENIKSPFVLGLITPKIYLPAGLSGAEYDYILLHERTHIRRNDHAIKFAAYFILALHWFNPLAWIAFLLMSADMEMSCDEFVLKEMGLDAKTSYSRSLVSFAENRRIIGTSPLAFGEGGMKERVKNVLHFKKHSRVLVAISVILVVVLSIGLMMNRSELDDELADEHTGNYADEITSHNADEVVGNYSEYCDEFYVSVPSEMESYEPYSLVSGDFEPSSDSLSQWELQPSQVPPTNLEFVPEWRAYSIISQSLWRHPLPDGWTVMQPRRGGSNIIRFDVGVPFVVTVDYSVVNAPWGNEEKAILLNHATLLFESDFFAELAAISFNINILERNLVEIREGSSQAQGLERRYYETIITDIRMTVERDYDGTLIYRETSFTNIVPFFVFEYHRDIIFRWIPTGYDESEVRDIIYSLPLPEDSWEILDIHIGDTFLEYGPHVYYIRINYRELNPDRYSPRHFPATFGDNFREPARMLFNYFSELNRIGFWLELPPIPYSEWPQFNYFSFSRENIV